jgi:hypothetical protein
MSVRRDQDLFWLGREFRLTQVGRADIKERVQGIFTAAPKVSGARAKR